MSQRVTLKFKGKSTLKSVPGGLASIILGVLAVTFAITLGRDMFEKKKPITRSDSRILEDNSISLDSFPIAVEMVDNYGRPFTEEFIENNILYFLSTSTDERGAFSSIQRIEAAKCSEVLSEELKSMFISPTPLFCPKLPKDSETKVRNDPYDINSSMFSINVRQCKKGETVCKKAFDEKAIIMVRVYYLETLVDNQNFGDPLVRFLKIRTLTISDELLAVGYNLLVKNRLVTDSGILYSDNDSIEFVSSVLEESQVSTANAMSQSLFSYTFGSKKYESVSMREYIKAPQVLANLIGIMKGLYLVVAFCVSSYSKYLVYKELLDIKMCGNKNSYLNSSIQGLNKTKSVTTSQISYFSFLKKNFRLKEGNSPLSVNKVNEGLNLDFLLRKINALEQSIRSEPDIVVDFRADNIRGEV